MQKEDKQKAPWKRIEECFVLFIFPEKMYTANINVEEIVKVYF